MKKTEVTFPSGFVSIVFSETVTVTDDWHQWNVKKKIAFSEFSSRVLRIYSFEWIKFYWSFYVLLRFNLIKLHVKLLVSNDALSLKLK